MDFDSMDPRDVELGALGAIYPEMRRVTVADPYTVTLDIPVNPPSPVPTLFLATQVTLPATESTQPPNKNPNMARNGEASPSKAGNTTRAAGSGPRPAEPVAATVDESHDLSYLPPVRVEMVFGPAYPAKEPLRVSISTDPHWLPVSIVRQLEEDGTRLWEELDHDIVGYALIDHIYQAADTVFGLVNQKTGFLEVDARHKIAMLDLDIKAQRAAFERKTIECGVCLDPKNGSVCHRMLDCGHVFCVRCLQDFYNNAISEGDVAAIRCLAPGCAKDREKAAEASLSSTHPGKKGAKKPRTFINPSELLQIPLQTDMVKRYVDLKYKTQLEADKTTIYCPRKWCSGAARSKRHKKPEGLNLFEVDDDDDHGSRDNEEGKDHDTAASRAADIYRPVPKRSRKGARQSKGKENNLTEELLAICEDCSFAFCRRCTQSWHGEFVLCSAPRQRDELTAEEKASEEYFKLHTTPCPTCEAPSQKTSGCNHMICCRCQTHFCYLCSAWLDPENPYKHYNQLPDGKVTSCHMRLWELERGDGDDVGLGFGEIDADEDGLLEEEDDDDDDDENGDWHAGQIDPVGQDNDEEDNFPQLWIWEPFFEGHHALDALDAPRLGDGPGMARRRLVGVEPHGEGDVGIDANHADWIRRFVALAMNDEEDEFDDDDI